MAYLYGREWTRQELLSYVGNISQVGGVRMVTLDDGPERGVRAAEFRSGEGFNFMVLLDRGMDLGPAEYEGGNRSGGMAPQQSYQAITTSAGSRDGDCLPQLAASQTSVR